MHIANRLQELRQTAGISQEQLADKLGIKFEIVVEWENGREYPDTASVIKMSEIYSVTTDYILKGVVTHLPQPMGKPHSPIGKAAAVLLVIGGCAVFTVLLIAALNFIG